MPTASLKHFNFVNLSLDIVNLDSAQLSLESWRKDSVHPQYSLLMAETFSYEKTDTCVRESSFVVPTLGRNHKVSDAHK